MRTGTDLVGSLADEEEPIEGCDWEDWEEVEEVEGPVDERIERRRCTLRIARECYGELSYVTLLLILLFFPDDSLCRGNEVAQVGMNSTYCVILHRGIPNVIPIAAHSSLRLGRTITQSLVSQCLYVLPAVSNAYVMTGGYFRLHFSSACINSAKRLTVTH